MKKFYSLIIFSWLMLLTVQTVSAEFPLVKTFGNKTADYSKPLDLNTTKYVYFNDMDEVADSACFIHINTMIDYKSKFVSLPYNGETFKANNITDFDLAVFPLGDNMLNASTDGQGANVIVQKMKDMVAAGKNILIFSRRALWWALSSVVESSPGKDPQSISFLNSDLGIIYTGTVPVYTQQGNVATYSGYQSKGTPKDPVGGTTGKMCNIKVGSSPPYEEPLRYYTYLDVFKSKDNTKFIDVEHFISGTTSGLMSDTLLGIRTQIGNSRIVFLSFGLENVAESFQRKGFLTRALAWLLEAAPQPGAQIEKLESELQFDNVVVGDKSVLTANFKSVGENDLVIDSLYIDDTLFEMGGFRIIDDLQLPMTVKPGNTISINIQFQPTEKASYFSLLTVVSNSKVSAKETVDLRGIGIEGTGPRISSNLVQNTLNFPKTKANEKSLLNLVLYNKGTENLIISDAKVTPLANPVYLDGFKKPTVIKPGDSLIQSVRFQPVQASKNYDGEITFTSNATDLSKFVVLVKAESDIAGGIDDLSNENIFSIFPNPVEIGSQLFIDSKNSGINRILVFDLLGNNICSLNNSEVSWMPVGDETNLNFYRLKIKIDSDRFLPGMYFIRFEGPVNSGIVPFIVRNK